MNLALEVQQAPVQEQRAAQQVREIDGEQMTHFHEANPSHVEEYEQNGESLRGFFQSLKK